MRLYDVLRKPPFINLGFPEEPFSQSEGYDSLCVIGDRFNQFPSRCGPASFHQEGFSN